MAYLPASGYITLNNPADPTRSINNVFGYGNNLRAYAGKRWYKANTATGTFPSVVTMPGDFYSKGPTNPVTPGGRRIYVNGHAPVPAAPAGYTSIVLPTGTQTYNFTVPLYATLSVSLYGGAGGGGGCDGNSAQGGSGQSGQNSSFGGYPVGAFGSGGGHGGVYPAPSGAGSTGYPQGGAGGGNNGAPGATQGSPGGAGGRRVLSLVNPQNGMPVSPGQQSGPVVGTTVTITVGAGGGGSGGGTYGYPLPIGLPGGAAGQWGWVDIGWT